MGKFCTKCGKPLEEGVNHVCGEQLEANVRETKVAPAAKSGGNDYVNSYIEMVKCVFTKPVDMLKKFTSESNFGLSMIAMALNCAVTGLFVYLLIKEIFKGISQVGSSFLSMFGLGSFGSAFGSVEVPFMQIFLYTALFMAAWFASCALMIFLIANVIMKDKITIKEAFSLVGNTSVFTTVTTAACIVLIYLSMNIAFYVLIIAAIFYLTYLAQGLSEKVSIDKNKLAYVFVPSILVATFVVCYVLPRILINM